MSDTYTVIRGQFECPWCDKAIALLQERGLPHTVVKLPMGDLVLKQAEVGHTTVPMVFAGEVFIGGYDSLSARLV